jgi:hypothetical protein
MTGFQIGLLIILGIFAFAALVAIAAVIGNNFFKPQYSKLVAPVAPTVDPILLKIHDLVSGLVTSTAVNHATTTGAIAAIPPAASPGIAPPTTLVALHPNVIAQIVAGVTAAVPPGAAPDPKVLTFKDKNDKGGGFGGYDAAADIARVARENAWLATLAKPDYTKVDLAKLGALNVPPKRIADVAGGPAYEESRMNILRRGMAGETLTLEEQVYVLGGPYRFSGLVDGSPATFDAAMAAALAVPAT